MANHKSAIKRIRQTARRYQRNRSKRSRLRSALKAFHASAASGKDPEVAELLNSTVSMVDKSAQKGVIHRNKANRLKASLARAASQAGAKA